MKKLFLILVLALIGVACTPTPRSSTEKTQGKILLLVSVPPYQSLVQQIAGDSFEVTTVVPPSADPHTYEPTARQLSEIAGGQLWFQIGEPFEKKLSPLLPKAQAFDLRQGLSMIQTHQSCSGHHHDTMDRHIWLSPKMVAIQIDTIAEALSTRYPGEKEGITARTNLLREQLTKLDQEIELTLVNTGARSFLISHPAFAYFCRDYRCNQLSVEQEGKEPKAKELEQILASALENGTRIAIAIPQHNNKGAQLIADKLRIPVRVLDPYANDCLETMRKLANLIENPYQTDTAP
jgi:zinc transport system substrate-binding protein